MSEEHEPTGGNMYKPHLLMVNSGTFWRCSHGNTGLTDGLRWIGCAECATAILSRLDDDALAKEVAGAWMWRDAMIAERAIEAYRKRVKEG